MRPKGMETSKSQEQMGRKPDRKKQTRPDGCRALGGWEKMGRKKEATQNPDPQGEDRGDGAR